MSYLDDLDGFSENSEPEDQDLRSFNFTDLQMSLMETTGTPAVGNPIHPNPLEGYFKAQPTAEEIDHYEEVPVAETPSQQHTD